MPLFKKAAPKPPTCDMCDAVFTPGDGHHMSHVVQIEQSEPRWLPDTLREEAIGQYTFACSICNSFPAMYWPRDGGAYASMQIHLGVAHNRGTMASMFGARGNQKFDMLQVQQRTELSSGEWTPQVRMDTARPAIFELAHAMHRNNAQVRAAIAEQVRLANLPSGQEGTQDGVSQDGVAKPWRWLSAVMGAASDSGDYALAAAGFLWALHWTKLLVPKCDREAFAQMDLYPIPANCRTEIHQIGLGALNHLPDEFVVAGDDTGQVRVANLKKWSDMLISS